MAHKVVIPNQLPFAEPAVGYLEAEGCEIVRLPPWEPGAPSEWTDEEIARYWSDADAFLGNFRPKPMSRKLLSAATKLRVGVSPVIGTESIDVEAATDLGIAIGYGAAPENHIGVAEAVVMLSAALIKNLPAKWDAVRTGGWRVTDPGHLVMNRTIGLVGLGNVGRAIAARFQGWEVNLLATDPYVSEDDARLLGVQLVDLDTLCRESQIISVATVLTAQTYHLVGEHEISLMRPDAYVINTSRGPCVDEEAVIKALDEDRIAGAAIDVWEIEPTRADNPLRTHPKVIATGHNVGHSEEVYAALPGLAAENVLKGLRGEPPTCFRNPEVLDAWKVRMAGFGVSVRA